ncbi:MAG: winged helix DNA-binding domain-containing protein, partial [Chloroflexi bacterium]|nr:winged helix DNA-binding domain-containing protein [Chloroflexota bacterium]
MLTDRDIATQHLINQHIDGEQHPTPEAVVTWMGAIQAQDYKQALWAIGVRMQSATVAAVEAAIAAGKIIRTWPMRGTIHFIPADDVRWMLALCASRVLAGHGRRMRQLDLTEDTMRRCEALFVDALSGKPPM